MKVTKNFENLTNQFINAETEQEGEKSFYELIEWLDYDLNWDEKVSYEEWVQFIDQYYRKMENDPQNLLTFFLLDLILNRYFEPEKIKELKDQVDLPF